MKDFTDNLIESYIDKSKTTISEAVNLNPTANDPDEMSLQFELDDYDEDGNLKDISAWDNASAAYHAGDARTWKDELIKMERDPDQINVHSDNPHYQPEPMIHEDELDAAEVSMKKYWVQKAKEIEKQNAERNLFNYIDSNTMDESYETDENSDAWTDEDLAEALFKSLYESKLREDATVLTEANPKVDTLKNKFVIEDGNGHSLEDNINSYKQAKVALINQSTAARGKNIYLVGIAGNSEFELASAKNGTITDENKKELKRFETAVKTNSNSAASSTSRAQTQQAIDNNQLAEKQKNIISSLLDKKIIEDNGFGYQISSKFANAFGDNDEEFNQFKQIIGELSNDEKKLTAEELKAFRQRCCNLVRKYKENVQENTQADNNDTQENAQADNNDTQENANSQNEVVNEEAAQDLSKLGKAFSDKDINWAISAAVDAKLKEDNLKKFTQDIATEVVTKAGLGDTPRTRGMLIGAAKQLINATITKSSEK